MTGDPAAMPPCDVCCPGVPRIEPLRTKGGLIAFDVHRHKGLLRGNVAEEGRNRVLHWLWPHGRLSEAHESEYDLRRTYG